ncbi:hypothetical protein ABK040_002919 [Willaertia magna]
MSEQEHNEEFFDEEEDELQDNDAFTSIWDLVPGYSQSPLDSMLENEEGTTLEQVLDEDTLIQELKSANHKVISYLSRDDNINKLIHYITTEDYLEPGVQLNPLDLEREDEETLKRIYKYPFITSEIFNCDIEEIITPIIKSKEKTFLLFSYLLNKDESKTPRNPSLSQYFVKTVSTLFQKYYKEIVETLMEKQNELNVLQKLFTSHIGLCDMDILILKLLGFETADDTFDQDGFGAFATQQRIRELFLMKQRGNDMELQQKKKQVREWAIKNNIFDLVLDKLANCNEDEEVHRNVFSLFSQIVEKGTNNDLTNELLSEKHLNSILDIMLKNSGSTILVHGIPFLRIVISANDEIEDSDDDTSDEGTQKSHQGMGSKIIPIILSRTKQFTSLLNDQEFITQLPSMALTHGVLDPPLGETRLRVIEHLLTLFKISQNNLDYQKELTSLNVMNILIDLFFKYEFNSMLHCQVYDMIKIVLTSNNTEMKLKLIKDCELCQKLLAAHDKNKQRLSESKGFSLGYMGFVVEISNAIRRAGEGDSELAKYLTSVQGWKEYVFGPLLERNTQNEKQLGGPVPIGTFSASAYAHEEEDDDDYGYDEEDSSDSDEEVVVKRTHSDSDSDDDSEVIRKKPEEDDQVYM